MIDMERFFKAAIIGSCLASSVLPTMRTLANQATVSSPAADGALLSGIDQSLIDKGVKPGDDFYFYSNQKWLSTTKIPADKPDYGIFSILDDQTQEQVKTLIEEVASEADAKQGSAAQKVGDLYRSYTDLAKRNAVGLSPIKPLIDELQKVDSMETLCQVMGKHHRFGVSSPLGVYVSVDARNSDRYITYADQDGLSLPDRDYYLVDEPQYLKLREELASYALTC